MNKAVKNVLSLALALCFLCLSFAPAYAVGEICSIGSAESLLKFAENCILDTYSAGLTVELTADIDLTGIDFKGIPTFSGVFNGNGHTVTGLEITAEGSAQGFFRYIETGAIVKDLHICGSVTPEGSRSSVGGIAGVSGGTIENCSFEGTVTGADRVGGIVGENRLTGIITSCSAAGDVVGNHFVGGIAGANYGVIKNAENNAAINTTAAQNDVELSDISINTITDSESANTVTDVGGIAGTSSGVIRNSENRGNVGYQLMGYNIGGIAGSQSGYISACDNYGDVRGRKEVGGIVGHMEPVTIVEYTEDTLQVLEGQANTLGALTNQAAANAQSGATQITGQIAVLEGHTQTAREALEVLMPDENGQMPDADTILAAQNNLTQSINAMPNAVGNIASAAESTLYGVGRDLQAISNQVGVMTATIGNASDNLGFNVTDISDEDTEEDLLGKVESCKNYGAVLGDGNVGGIAGAMAYENDLDHEDDVNILGEESLNFSGEIRAVVRSCYNYGSVTVKKQNGGGIVGWQSLGLVRECLNTGGVDGTGADYVGGVTGSGGGFLRQCGAKCIITGGDYVGGISATANIVTDCRSMVKLTASEKFGAILGYSVEKPALTEEEGKIRGNFYLTVEHDIGGIDGISYEGCAQSLTQKEFFALSGVDNAFRVVTVRFVFEDGSYDVVKITPGRALSSDKIPAIPEKEGYNSRWDGIEEIDTVSVAFDATVYAVYTRKTAVIESDECEGDKPLVLVQGEFDEKNGVELEKLGQELHLEKREEFICGYSFAVTGGRADKLRCLVGEDAGKVRVVVTDENGNSRPVDSETEGSYVTFEVQSGDCAFAVIREAKSYTLEIAVGAAAVAVIALIVILTVRKKKA